MTAVVKQEVRSYEGPGASCVTIMSSCDQVCGNNIKCVGVPRSFVLFNSIWVISNGIKQYHRRIIWTENNLSPQLKLNTPVFPCLALE